MEKAQKRVKDFMGEQGLSSSPEARMLDLVSEVGELAKEVLKGSDYGTAPLLPGAGLEEEMGDCLFSLLALCSAAGLDAEKALAAALEKYAARAARTGQVGSGG